MTDRSPHTPAKQLGLSSEHNQSDWNALNCSPAAKSRLQQSLKRKASSRSLESTLSHEGASITTDMFFRWRRTAIDDDLAVLKAKKAALQEAQTESPLKPEASEILKSITREIGQLCDEKVLIIGSRKPLSEDLEDSVAFSDKSAIADAYVHELRKHNAIEGSDKARQKAANAPRMERKKFKQEVLDYLGNRLVYEDTGDVYEWCNVLACYLSRDQIKCAHIVPYSWDSRALGHIFGTDEDPLVTPRNGLSLQSKIEQGFDNGWIAIVPANDVAATPTEWKVVLLNTARGNDTFLHDHSLVSGQSVWRWNDIDQRKLTFKNDNRPARRFLYLRYALAQFHAKKSSWPGLSKIPSTEVWATPNKPKGYLRRFVLMLLAEKIGDKLPKGLIGLGTFEDPDASSKAADEIAAIRVGANIKGHLSGQRDEKDNDEEESEGSDD